MKNACLIHLVGAALLIASIPACAGLLHEDVAYWYCDADRLLTVFNPSADWLAENIPTGRVLVKVQQTVYDPVSALSILARNGDGTDHVGCLYSYTVTNLNVGDLDDPADMGITDFAVSWAVPPDYITVGRHAPVGWVVDAESASQPAWKWTGPMPGLLPGSTVGGFWAVTSIATERVADATVVHAAERNPEILCGKTTGPVPEAPAVLALATGIVGVSVVTRMRRYGLNSSSRRSM